MLLLGATVSFQCMCVELLAQCLETNIVSSKTMLAVGIINSITSDIIKYEYRILFIPHNQLSDSTNHIHFIPLTIFAFLLLTTISDQCHLGQIFNCRVIKLTIQVIIVKFTYIIVFFIRITPATL